MCIASWRASSVGAAVELDERRRSCSRAGARTRASVPPSKRCGAGDDDVLARAGAISSDALALEARPRRRAVRVRPRSSTCSREGLERVVLRDGLGLAADADDRAPDAVSTITPTSPSVVARSARLPAAAMPFSRSSVRRGLEVASGLLERALAGHHPRAGLVAELLDEAGADLGHASRLHSRPPPARADERPRAPARRRRSRLRLGRRLRARRPRVRRRPRRGLGRARAARELGLGHLRACAAAMPSAIARITSEHERIASSLPGMT